MRAGNRTCGRWFISGQVSQASAKNRKVAPIDDSDVVQGEEKVVEGHVLDNSKPVQALVCIHVTASATPEHNVGIEAGRGNVGSNLLANAIPTRRGSNDRSSLIGDRPHIETPTQEGTRFA